MIVEGTRPRTGPPSIISIPFREIDSILLGGGSPEIFALVAVIGTFTKDTSLCARGWLQTLIPILPVPPVRFDGSLLLALKTMVSGPGQYFFIKWIATSGTSITMSLSQLLSAMMIGIGLDSGRFFTLNISSTAFLFKAFVPKA